MNLNLEEYCGKCSCGKTHSLSTKIIIIESGASSRFKEVADSLELGSGGRILCDTNTRRYADSLVDMCGSVFSDTKPVAALDAANLHADEKGVALAEEMLPEDTVWLVAAGAGTIHDITRYIAYKRKIPFISYPTACSVDGFVSTVCAMTWFDFKKTMPGVAPIAAIADTKVFGSAPYRLTTSGVSDILGKYTALADWQCGRILMNEDFCERIYLNSKKTVDNVREYLPAIHAGEEDAYETLMLALILSGISMQMWGDSRPASGSEHHLSHFWEMGIINPVPDALHGEKVGVGLLVTLRVYEKIARITGFEQNMQPYSGMPLPLMRKKLGGLYEAILKENQPDLLRSVSPEKMAEKFPEIRQIIDDLPDARKLRPFMQATGCVTTLEDIGLDRDILPDSIILSPFVRRRLTIMRAAKLLPEGYI